MCEDYEIDAEMIVTSFTVHGLVSPLSRDDLGEGDHRGITDDEENDAEDIEHWNQVHCAAQCSIKLATFYRLLI